MYIEAPDPIVTVVLKEKTAIEGSSFTVFCDSNIHVKWYYSTDEDLPRKVTVIKPESGKGSGLKFSKVKKEHAGGYVCVGLKKEQKYSDNFELTIVGK